MSYIKGSCPISAERFPSLHPTIAKSNCESVILLLHRSPEDSSVVTLRPKGEIVVQSRCSFRINRAPRKRVMTPIKRFALLAVLFMTSQSINAKVVYELDFSQAKGDVKTWFEDRGWKTQGDILKMKPRFENGTLVLEAMKSHSGAFFYQFSEDGFLKNASHIHIEWGVEQYPQGSDWSGPVDETRNTRDPINVMISFGTKKIGSGSLVVPAIPYFIGLFPADGEEAGKAYYGNYWQKGGRYFCISGNGTTEPISTHFALSEKFRETFGKPAPPISGLTIEVDAKNTTKMNGRHTKAYIRNITFLSE